MAAHPPSSNKSESVTTAKRERIGLACFAGLQAILIAVVPLLVVRTFFFPFIVPRTGTFMILVSLLVLVWLWLHYENPARYRLPWRNPIVIAVGGMLGVWTVSGLLGADWTLSFWSSYQRMTGIMMLGYLFMWLLVSVAVLRQPDVWRRLLQVLVATGVLVSVYTILGPHGFGVFTGLDMSRGGATIGNTSFLGAYILFTLFTGLILAYQERQSKRRSSRWLRAGILTMLLSPAIINYNVMLGRLPVGEVAQNPFLLIGHARAVAASILVGLVVAGGLYLLRQRKPWQKVLGAVLGIGPMVASVVLWVLIFNQASPVHVAFGELTSWSRFHVWREALIAFQERPLLGWGPESFDLLHQRFFDPLLMSTYSTGELWYDRAHNIVIDTMVSTGIIGLVAYASVFVSLMFVVFRLRKAGSMSNGESALIGGLMFAYILQNMTVFDMTVSLVPFFLILAYIAAKLPREAATIESKELQPVVRQALYGAGGVVVIVCMFAWPIRIMQGSWAVSASFRAESTAERLDYYETAFAVPISRTLFLRTVASHMYDSLRAQPQLINSTSTNTIQAEAEFLEAALVHEAEARPFNYRAWYNASKMAQLQVFVGRMEKLADAERYARQAVAIAPQNPLGHLALYEIAAMQENFEAARMHLETMISVAPSSPFIAQSYRSALATLEQLETKGGVDDSNKNRSPQGTRI